MLLKCSSWCMSFLWQATSDYTHSLHFSYTNTLPFFLHQAGSWQSSTPRPLSPSVEMTESGPTRASSPASTIMASKSWIWPPRGIPTSRWMAACGWWVMCRPAGVRHAPPHRCHQRCPPPLLRPPPPYLPPPPGNSARHLLFRYSGSSSKPSCWGLDENVDTALIFLHSRWR